MVRVQTDNSDDDLFSRRPSSLKDGQGQGQRGRERQRADEVRPRGARRARDSDTDDLDDAQKAELLKHLDAIKKSGQQEPRRGDRRQFPEIERIKRGGSQLVEVSVNGNHGRILDRRPGRSAGAASAADHARRAARQGKDAGEADFAGKASDDAAAGAAPPEVWGFDAAAKKWDGCRAGRTLETAYTLSDGLQVVINSSEISSEEQSGVVVGRLSLELIVFELPHNVGQDYPWKLGQVENRSITLAGNPKHGIDQAPRVGLDVALARCPLSITDKAVIPKASAGLIKLGGVTVRFSGLKNQSIRDVNGAAYHFVTILLTSHRGERPRRRHH